MSAQEDRIAEYPESAECAIEEEVNREPSAVSHQESTQQSALSIQPNGRELELLKGHLSPLWGFTSFFVLPGAHAPGFILAPLRG